ncbi:hypothetical protein WJX72_012459 [[Myrmecia] bisecta]|uniref:Uncharacterized protein n=1 Tax=[Myrmecia] bisecta TaxID=41462 RepID=A0AAW1R9N8_9CHLO
MASHDGPVTKAQSVVTPAQPDGKTASPALKTKLQAQLSSFYLAKRGQIAWISLAVAVAAAAAGWPEQMRLEKSWHRPLRDFITAICMSVAVAVATGLSPSLSPYRKFHWIKMGGVWFVLGSAYTVFGLFGPNGFVTLAALILVVVGWR